MKMMNRQSFACFLLITTSASAMAQATQPEADRIKSALEKYLGNVAGVVTVAPKGSAYELKLDFKPYAALAKQPDMTFNMTPMVINLSPKGDGTWDVNESDSPSFEFKMGDTFRTKYSLGQGGWSGVFDEKNQAFLSYTFDYKNTSIQQSTLEGGKTIVSNATFEALLGTGKSVITAPGVVDSTQHIEMLGMRQEMSGMSGGSPSPLGDSLIMTSPSLVYDTTTKGMRQSAIYDLVAWAIAHAGAKEAVIRDQTQLKEKLLSALPLWESLSAKSVMTKPSFQAQLGAVTMDNLTSDINMSGLTKQGQAQIAFGFTGLSIPQGILPPWMNEMMLKDTRLDVAIADFDLETMFRQIIAKMDLTNPDPLPEAELKNAGMMALAGGKFPLTFNPSFISNAIAKISYDGKFEIRLSGEQPSGKMMFSMAGLDAMLEKLQAVAATDPSVQQFIPLLIAAKGMAKSDGNGGHQWVVETAANNAVLVNGLDVSKMGGAQ